MRGGITRAGLIAVVSAAFTIGQGVSQQSSTQQGSNQQDTQPPGQTNPVTKGPLKPNQVDPNGKPSDLPDPTKDPTKDPATDPTKDPTKDPDAVTGQTGDNAAGADAAQGGVEAPDYTGPAILSRGFALSRPSLPENQPFRYYAGLSLVYDSGLLGAYVQNGTLHSIAAEGVDINWGASMRRYRRKSIFDFNYAGHYYEYFNTSVANGQDHSLGAGITRQVTPRLSIGVRETAGLYSNTYSVLNSTAVSDLSMSSATIVVAPTTEAFDDRAYFSTTTGSVAYQLTPRLSFSVNGAYFLVNRNSVNLADTKGYQAGGDIAYRITRRQTVGIYYNHSEFSYTKIFGDSNADSIGMNYAISLTRRVDLSVRAGGTRFDSQTLNAVTPNPLVQAVLGIQSGIEKDYIVGYAPDFTMTLNRNLRTSSIGASFTEGITPGNGLVLTSRSQSESAFFNLPTFRKYAMQIAGGRTTLSGYSNGDGSAGSYSTYFARLSATRPVSRFVSSFLNIDYRQDTFAGTTFHQKEFRISLGFRFSPGQGPIKFW
jgi:hypothetical protein